MKSLTPHDPLDDLIAAALHGELTPEERTHFDSRLKTDAAARAAYQEAQLMHDLLEKTYKDVQPDPAFEQRMVSGVRRKIQEEERPRETAWGSVVALWTGVTGFLGGRSLWQYGATCSALVAVFLSVVIYTGSHVKSVFTTISSQLSQAQSSGGGSAGIYRAEAKQKQDVVIRGAVSDSAAFAPGSIDQLLASASQAKIDANPSGTGSITTNGQAVQFARKNVGTRLSIHDGQTVVQGQLITTNDNLEKDYAEPTVSTTPQGGTVRGSGFAGITGLPTVTTQNGLKRNTDVAMGIPASPLTVIHATVTSTSSSVAPTVTTKSGEQSTTETVRVLPFATNSAAAPTPDTGRKLIRNAELELEVKSFQAAMDQIAALTKDAGGYVDTSNSERGGNGKLQGNVVVKVLPQNLDAFLLKLRDLGQLKNQMLKTDDVTKDYVDTQARITNSLRMEAQLQELLKHDTNKVAELLEVERELGRVRGEIEQMQGEIKVYDFQVAYATVTMHLRESDLNQTAAYLLKEQDDFALFATDVESTFQQARHTADDFKATILVANLQHNSGSDVSAQLQVTVPPDQIEAFLAQIKSLGRVANFTRQTQRAAKDGGDSNQAADQTLTEKDRVMVNIAIRSDDESRKQVALTVVTPAVDTALDQAKAATLAAPGAEVLSSSLNKTPQGQSTAQMSIRVPGKSYQALLASFRGLGRTASFSLQRDDNSGPGASGDDAPVIVSLALTDNDTPLQETDLAVRATDVDNQAQQLKKDAATAGVEVIASNFQRQPDGSEQAQMIFRLPMAKYAGFIETLKKLGKVEQLTVNRQDRPDQTRTDESAPAEIRLVLHNQRDLVTEDNGLWATLRKTFGEGASALFGSVRVIGVVMAFLIPWVIALGLLAWIGRRIYIWKKK